MLDVAQHTPKDRPSALAQWLDRAIGQPGVCLRVRWRGSNLHVLCESRQTLEAKTIINRLIAALKVPDAGNSFPFEPQNPIYKIIIYGRTTGHQRPDWIKQIGLKPPSDTQPQASQVYTWETPKTDSELIIANEMLPRGASTEDIAGYLNQTLRSLGVKFKVLIQEKETAETSDPQSSHLQRRLWVVGNSPHSNSLSLLVDPLVEKLRSLELRDFRDAAICSQITGEADPEWIIRVDLTPKEAMLKDWASWGEVQATARLLNQTLSGSGMAVKASFKEATLHLICTLLGKGKNAAPDKQQALASIVPVLEAIAPQGIVAATVFGVESESPEQQIKRSQQALSPRQQAATTPKTSAEPFLEPEQETAVWIEWLDLPAAKDPARAASVISLAQKGNQEALTFLLEKRLNPDLERRLTTGGIHLKIHRKQDLLHIMSEAPLCPSQAKVGPPVTQCLRQLALPGIAGVRIYGRRAGSASSSWNYGVDFAQRRRLVPEANPEFTASDAYLSEIMAPSSEPVLRKNLTKEDLKDGLQENLQSTVSKIQRWLCHSQLFVPLEPHQELTTVTPVKAQKTLGRKVAIVWGTVGLLLTIQADLLIGQQLKSDGLFSDRTQPQELTDNHRETEPLALPQISLQKGGTQATNDFNASEFTREGQTKVIIDEDQAQLVTPSRSGAATAAILAAARSSLPSFNNQQLDEKLALYQQHVLKMGPPDVLIAGSSRALRGVDPIALQDALAAQGYPNVEVFNFGVNGATAQVVDLLIRRVLTPEQLPKLIIWADGARAFNSGRVDNTYNAITTSDAYQSIKEETFPRPTALNNQAGQQLDQPLTFLSGIDQFVNEWLNQSLGKFSSTYSQRDQIKSQLQKEFLSFLERTNFSGAQTDEELQEPLLDQESIDADGFLPVSVRFNPATYYDKHPRVAGAYDSNYQFFQLSGKQDTSLESLLQFTKANGIGLVFVNLPLTNDYLDPVRKEHEEQFRRHMHSSALDRGLIFRDLTDLMLTKHDYFSDPSHLNRYGAYKVSQKLAQDPMIPWSLAVSP
ncbi:hypothetical protein [Lyngbya aestuarii]|uniref:hypothetical protein n=1 Tax=Lyngbya aestuarii TaxID=118322 RepID=UPI00403D66A3